jgi:hypothetical protein
MAGGAPPDEQDADVGEAILPCHPSWIYIIHFLVSCIKWH